MEAIVKKMQAMKVEKDSAMDDSDTWEVKTRNVNTRRAKLEEELQLESDCDRAREELTQMEEKVEQKDTALNNVLTERWS